MDLKVLEKILECNSIPMINRIAGTSYDSDRFFVEGVKIDIIRDVCTENDLVLCETKEDEVLSILKENICYTNNQRTLQQILYKHGYHTKSLPPEMISCENISSINEDRTAKKSEIIRENKDTVINNIVSRVVEKIQMCPDYSSLFLMEDDLNEIGMSINNSNNNIIIRRSNGNKIIEDYIPISLVNNQHDELNDKIVECLIKFIKQDYNDDIISKIDICPNYSSVMGLEEDLNKIGLTIRENNNKILLCKIKNEEVNLRIFEDYIPITSIKNQNNCISNRMAKCIVKFIEKAKNESANVIKNTDKKWVNGASFYGNAIGIVQDRPSN